MNDPTDAWAEVERRASLSGTQGLTADSDDLVDDTDLGEADINPNSKGGKGGGGSGSGMMPPMMMGGKGGGAGGAAPAGGGGAVMGDPAGQAQVMGAVGMARGAAPAAMGGAGGLSSGGIPSGGMGSTPGLGVGAGGLGVGAGGLGAGGVGMGAGVTAAGSSPGDVNGDGITDRYVEGGIDVDGDGVADLPHGSSGPGGIGAPGRFGGDVGGMGGGAGLAPGSSGGIGGIDGAAGPGTSVSWGTGSPGYSDLPSGVGGPGRETGPGGAGHNPGWDFGTSNPGPNGGSHSGVPVAPGAHGPTGPGGNQNPTGVPVRPGDGGINAPSGSSGVPGPGSGGSGAASSSSAVSGTPNGTGGGSNATVGSDPSEMRRAATRWSQLSAEMQGLAADSQKKSDFGLVKNVEPSHEKLSGAASQWSSGASSEFDSLRGKLGSAAGAFEDNEQYATGQARTMND